MSNKINITAKQKLYNKNVKVAETAVDALGKHLDPKIKDFVIILNTMRFETKGSCEGHIKESSESRAPWIDVAYKGIVEDQKRWNKEYNRIAKLELIDKAKTATGKKKVYTKLRKLQSIQKSKSAKIALKLEELIKEFYKKRKIQDLDNLIYLKVGISGIRIEPYGSELQIARSNKDKIIFLKKYQKEFSDFEKFLKTKYFNNK